MKQKLLFSLIVTISVISLTTILFAQNAEAQSLVPEWVKNNAAWWAEGTVDDQTFLNGIEFLIENNVITAIAMNGACIVHDFELALMGHTSEDVDIEFDNSIARATRRDISLFRDEKAILERYKKRYIPGQRLYFAESQPIDKAEIIITNDDIANPNLNITM